MDLCEQCVHYVYDEDWECYSCDVNLDEDDMVKFLQGRNSNCSFFRLDDEYGVVRKQMQLDLSLPIKFITKKDLWVKNIQKVFF